MGVGVLGWVSTQVIYPWLGNTSRLYVHPSMNGWYMYKMNLYSAVKKNEIVKLVRKRWNQSIFYDYMSIKFRVKFPKLRLSALSKNLTKLPRTFFPLKIRE